MGNPMKLSHLVTSDYSSYKKNKSLSDLVTNDFNTKRNKANYTEAQARDKARYLASKLNNPSRLMLYLKYSWNLTDYYLDRLLAISLTKDDPIRYFSKAASSEIARNAR